MAGEAKAPGARYSAVSIVLHWTLALLILWQIFFNARFADMPRTAPDRPALYALHVSFGVLILLLSLGRLGWRLANPAPPLPVTMPAWEKILARASHVGLYVFMIGMPLSGWAMISARTRPLPDLFGTAALPRLPGLAGLSGPFEFIHTSVLLWGFYALLALHVAGALKHQFIDRDIVLWRMLPLVGRPGSRAR